ncbi:MAG: carboxypeptidase-like regulatory domain-containing protein [Bacteroidota bacterium]|nr:carboxypeptidase-like regulatory domain-containing protein [Bacteroidota bacterium]
MKPIFFLILSIAFSFNSKAFSLSGLIVDKNNSSAITYANVGVVGKGVGTVTDETGRFTLNLHDSLKNSVLRISYIGYKSQNFPVSELLNGPAERKFLLEENLFELGQVVIRPKVYKTKVLGNTNNSSFALAGFKSNDLGSELGTIMKIRKSPTFIENVNFNIGRNNLDSIIFRMNIYSMKNGQPDSILLKEPIYVTLYTKSGTLSVDLKKYSLRTTTDFFVSLEWIKDYGINNIYFCAGLMDSNSMFRKTSQDKWEKSTPVGIGFNSTVTYEK